MKATSRQERDALIFLAGEMLPYVVDWLNPDGQALIARLVKLGLVEAVGQTDADRAARILRCPGYVITRAGVEDLGIPIQ